MNILRRIFGGLPGTFNDPLFGALTRQDGLWSGQLTWDHTPTPFSLTVHRANEVPSQVDRTVFEALRCAYPALRSSLQGAVHDLWSGARKAHADELPDLGGSLDLWARLQLQGVGLHEDGHAQLIFGFTDPTLPDGAFIVSVHGTEVEPLEYLV